LDCLASLIFVKLDSFLSRELWRHFDTPLHDTFLGFL
jgi:hypothetical protein